jgi:hypothetical protein
LSFPPPQSILCSFLLKSLSLSLGAFFHVPWTTLGQQSKTKIKIIGQEKKEA